MPGLQQTFALPILTLFLSLVTSFEERQPHKSATVQNLNVD